MMVHVLDVHEQRALPAIRHVAAKNGVRKANKEAAQPLQAVCEKRLPVPCLEQLVWRPDARIQNTVADEPHSTTAEKHTSKKLPSHNACLHHRHVSCVVALG